MTSLIPANALETMWLAFHEQAPMTAHGEIALQGQIAPQAFVEAARRVEKQHPLLTVRREAASGGWRQVGDQIPCTAIENDEEPLPDLRRRVVSQPFDLGREGPARFHLISGTPRSRLIIVGDHALVDGLAIRRVALSMLEALADHPVAPVDQTWRVARDLHRSPVPRERALEVIDRLRSFARSASVRVARDRFAAPSRTYGVSYRRLSTRVTRALSGPQPTGSTASDVVVASVALALTSLNSGAGQTPLPLTIGIPVNLRPPRSWDEGVCNAVLPWPVRIETDQPSEVLEAVSCQLRAIRASALSPDIRALLSHISTAPALPLWVLHGVASMTTMVSSVPAVVDPRQTEGGHALLSARGGAPASPAMSVTFAIAHGSCTNLSARYLPSHHSEPAIASLLHSIERNLETLYDVEASHSGNRPRAY